MLRAAIEIATVASLAGIVLRGLDAVPGLLLGLPRGVIACSSLDEAEVRLGVKLSLPRNAAQGYLWPPRSIRYAARPSPALAVRFDPREGSRRLTMFWSRGPSIPESLRAAGRAFHRLEVKLGGRSASLTSLTLDQGEVWQDLEWVEAGGRVGMRFRGPTVELMRLAETVEERP